MLVQGQSLPGNILLFCIMNRHSLAFGNYYRKNMYNTVMQMILNNGLRFRLLSKNNSFPGKPRFDSYVQKHLHVTAIIQVTAK